MSTYKVKMTSGTGSSHADVTKLSESEIHTMERRTEKVSVKLSPRMLKKMKNITGLQGSISNEKILFEFVKYMTVNFAQ